MFDVICVGGGPAGSAAASFLARRGFSVLVLDRDRFPREKACGEGILPHGKAVLDRIGVALPEARSVRGLRFRVDGETAFLPFPEGSGLAVRRLHLDHALIRHAEGSGARVVRAGVHRVEPGRVHTDRGTFEGRFLIGADGPTSVFHRSFGIRVDAPPGRVGLSTHLTGFDAEPGTVEVALIPGGEVYLTPVDRGLTLVALLLDRRAAPRPDAVIPFLREVLPHRTVAVVAAGPVLAAAPLATRARAWSGPGWVLIGDAAGRIDPVSGQGISVALATAEMAAETVERVLGGRGHEAEFEARARAFRRPLERVTRWLAGASAHPALARRLLRRPQALVPLVRAATGLDPGRSPVGFLLRAVP